MPTETDKLKIKLIQPTDMFADDAFNNVIKDLDNKVVGIAHLTSGAHWEVWEKDTKYAKGDVVRTTTCKSNQYFQCIVGGTSGKDEPKNQGTGAQITDNTATWIINEIGNSGGNGGASVFIGNKYYTRGQLAIFNGVLYRSIKDHIAEQTFQLDIANWQKLYSNIREWADSTFYFSEEIVINDNKLYKCKQDHVSAGTFVSDINAWESLSSNGIETFKPSTYYNDGAIVVDGNRLYRCTLAHTSTTDLISDIQNWKLLSNVQEWETNKTYIQGNIVLYDNTPYKVIKNHVSNDFSLDKDNFELTYSNIRDFNPTMFYKNGSYVLYDNNIYKALKDTTGDIGNHLQLQTKVSFLDANNIYTKIIGTDSLGYNLFTEPTGNYINNVIDLGNVYDVTKITLSDKNTRICNLGETVIETSTDGTSYIEANSFTTYGFNDNTSLFKLNINKKARYIKIVFKSVYKGSNGTGNRFDVNTVSIYATNPDWQKITNTQKPSIETWGTGTEYKKNEIVVYNEKIYKCAVDHTSGIDFSADKPKYWESLSDNPIINDWISGNNYEVGTCVIKSNQNGIVDWTASKQYNVNDEVVYNGYIYTCKTQNTDTEFTEANWEVKEPVYNRIYRCIKNTNSKDFNESEWQLINGDSYSSNKILDWKPKKGYNKGEMVYYDNILYRAKANIISGTDFTQEQNNWELVCTQIPEWTSSCYYVQGAIVEYNNKIYKCKTTNSDVAFTESNWTNIGGGSSVEEWKPKKQYNSNDLVINDNKLYLCIQRNMSTDSFEDDSNYWVLLSATEHNNYGQVNRLGAKKGDTFNVSVQKTATLSFPPVEVLKLSGVTKGVSENIFDYNSGDGNKFTVNNAVANKSKFIIFDGVAKPNNEYKYALGDYIKMTTNYYMISEEIDPSEFKTLEKVELIE